jgi:uncharacterized protein (DUF4415 family)
MSKIRTTRFRLDPDKPPKLTARQARRLDGVKPDVSDIPELTKAFWEKNRPRVVPSKAPVTLRLDSDVLEYFRRGGKRYQTRINSVLRAFVEAQRKRA